MPEHPNELLLRRGYAAIEARDLDALNEMISADVCWHVGGTSKIAGDHPDGTRPSGRDAVFAMFGHILMATERAPGIAATLLLAALPLPAVVDAKRKCAIVDLSLATLLLGNGSGSGGRDCPAYRLRAEAGLSPHAGSNLHLATCLQGPCADSNF